MPPTVLQPDRLRHICKHHHFHFESTAELEVLSSIIGQPRGVRAIEFAIGIESQGYNMFVLGDAGTGRATALKRFLQERTQRRPTPPDWVYVHNFQVPHQPRAIRLPAGEGKRLRSAAANLVACVETDLPKAFDTEAYRVGADKLTKRLDQRREELFGQLEQQASERNFTLVETPSGPLAVPLTNGQAMTPEQLQQLPGEERRAILSEQEDLNAAIEAAVRELRALEREVRADVNELNRSVAAAAIGHHFNYWRDVYKDVPDVQRYFDEFEQDVLDNLSDFVPAEEMDADQEDAADRRRYEVNLLIDNSETTGAPVVVESNPTLHSLIGRMEYELRYGVMATHFTYLQPGSLHRANGGYLVLTARDVLRQESAWAALKRAIKNGEIRIQSPNGMDGGQVLAKSLDPQPIPLSIKIILLGTPDLYYLLYDEDEEFGELFKVKADFDSEMLRDDEHELQYAQFIATRCHEEGLRHFDRPAVEKVIEHGSRLAEHQKRLSTRFGEIADLIREANYWASEQGHELVTAADVQQALRERIYRTNRLEDKIQEDILENFIYIATEGSVIGQVNGLSIIDMGDYAFGQPGRITARVYMGEAGVVNIEREVEMAGPIHNKGLLTLVGYLGGHYAQEHPLSLSASLTFEQNYAGIDGDSASAAELFALLSSLSELPMRQDIAITGSINQRGEIQPVGRVTEKVEGFYDICRLRRLSGEQGVLIPHANIHNLMLREDVVEAVRAGRFHIWAAETVEEGIELLTGVAAGALDEAGHYPENSVHGRVQARLYSLAHELRYFSDHAPGDSSEHEE